MVREAAAAAIIAAQLVLRDEAHLFALLDGLPDDKKNLLTYLFDKHGCRDTSEALGTTTIPTFSRAEGPDNCVVDLAASRVT